MRKTSLLAAALAITIGAGAFYYGAAVAAPAQGPTAAITADDTATALAASPADDEMMLADDAPMPPPGPDGHPPMGMAPPGPPIMGGADWHHGGHHAWGHGSWEHRSSFALLYNPEDKNLGAADVQKIAEALLLMHGNHTWKVTDVSQQDDTIAFSFSAGDNATIAKFTMDRHTGRIHRTA